MARPLRMDYPDTFYHVLSRGNERKEIFRDEKDPESVLRVRKYRCQNRDVAIYVLYQLGVYLNREIGKVFGVGYTAVPGAVKRGQGYLRSDGQLERVVKKIIADI